jgi:hypothetical protein
MSSEETAGAPTADPLPGLEHSSTRFATVMETLHVIENRTARRIAIAKRGSNEIVVIPPLGKRTVSATLREGLDLEGWICRDLVACSPQNVPEEPLTAAAGALGLLVWAILIGLPAGLLVDSLRESTLYWGAWSALLLGLVGVAVMGWAKIRARISRAAGRLVRLLGILLVGSIGFGVPLVLLSVQLSELQAEGTRAIGDLGELFLGIFVVFVGIVSTLPALLYFLFDQQQMGTVRTNFFREVMRLDPAIQTLEDAGTAYGPLLDEVYGGRKPGLVFNFAGLPVLVSTLLITLGWTITLLPTLKQILQHASSPADLALYKFFVPHQTAFSFAFLGVYFFTLNMVFRRYVRSDLGPKAYSHVAMRVIIAVVLAWIASAIPHIAGPDPAKPTAWLLVVAFFIGIVPETGTALYHDLLQSQQGWIGKLIPSLQERDPLSKLEGITLYDRARLLEEGIENIENLAHHNLVELMLRTRIPTTRLVDLVDQAILYLHVRDARQEGADQDASAAALNRLREYGIRTATDLEDAVRAARGRKQELQFLDLLGSDGGVQRLHVMLDALRDDEWMTHLRHWRDFRQSYHALYTLESFYPSKLVRVPPDLPMVGV